jgi:hypothetical protein
MKIVLLLIFLTLELWGQSQTKVAPDCQIPFAINNANLVTNSYNNLASSPNTGVPCPNWKLDYSSTGYSAISLVVEDAPDSSGSPGTFVTFAGSIVGTGINPNTAITSASTKFTGYFPWMRVRLASHTGTGLITGTLNGFRDDAGTISSSGGGGTPCPGTSGTPCVVDGPDATGAAPTKAPVQAAGLDGAGNLLPFQFPTVAGKANVTTSGNTQIIAASGSTVIRLGFLEFTPVTSGNTVNFKLVYGTGSNCATGATDLTAVQSNVLAYSHDFPFPLNVPSGKALCFNIDAATPTNVTFEYSQY